MDEVKESPIETFGNLSKLEPILEAGDLVFSRTTFRGKYIV